MAIAKYTAFTVSRELIWRSLEQRVLIQPSGCWHWKLSGTPSGYGLMNIGGKRYLAHRAAFFAWTGIDPIGLFVCHKCDNPPCCNPEHLFLGTASDNTRDFVRKGLNQHGDAHWTRRLPHLVRRGASHAAKLQGNSFYHRGDSHYLTKISDAQVAEARQMLLCGHSLSRVAAAFGVTKATIWKIKTNRTHVLPASR